MRSLDEMKVTCSAGFGEKTANECLACSKSLIHPPCNFDHGVLRAMFDQPERGGIHVTDLTGCLLSSWYTKTSPAPLPVHKLLAQHLGTFYHALAEFSDQDAIAEMKVEYNGVVGMVDRYYKAGRVVDFKTTKYIYINKLPYSTHTAQVNMYGLMLKKMGYPVTSLAIQYVCMGGPTKCRKHGKVVEWVDGELRCPVCEKTPANAHQGAYMIEVPILPEEEVETFFWDKANALQKAIDTHTQPEASPGWLCAYCAYEPICIEDFLEGDN